MLTGLIDGDDDDDDDDDGDDDGVSVSRNKIQHFSEGFLWSAHLSHN